MKVKITRVIIGSLGIYGCLSLFLKSTDQVEAGIGLFLLPLFIVYIEMARRVES
jgi:hypothetical protein